MKNVKQALIVIDVQNDYFPGGKFPLWKPEKTLENILEAIDGAREQGVEVILVQHIADAARGAAPFFVAGSGGEDIHPAVLEAAPEAQVVKKHHADSFLDTGLGRLLEANGIEELYLCGMQTQNCVGLTAVSRNAAKYKCCIVGDCCTAPSEMVHLLALAGFGDAVPVIGKKDFMELAGRKAEDA